MEHIANTPSTEPLRPSHSTHPFGYLVIHCHPFFRTPLGNPPGVTGVCPLLSLNTEVAVTTTCVVAVNVAYIVKELILSLSNHDAGLHPTISASIKVIDFHEVIEVFKRVLGGVGEVEGVRSTPNVGSTANNRHDARGLIV